MSFNFLTDPASAQIRKKHWWSKQRWKLTAPLVYDEDGETTEIPTGFEHDFASIPRFLWPILSPTGPYSRAAIVHDYDGDDKRFLLAMKSDGTPKWLARIMYAAVTHNSLPSDYDVTANTGGDSILGD